MFSRRALASAPRSFLRSASSSTGSATAAAATARATSTTSRRTAVVASTSVAILALGLYSSPINSSRSKILLDAPSNPSAESQLKETSEPIPSPPHVDEELLSTPQSEEHATTGEGPDEAGQAVQGLAPSHHKDGEASSEEEEMAAERSGSQSAAFNEETGEINWDCPCLGGMAHGPCGENFREAFSCFVFSEEEPKGVDCVEKFKAMQDCFRQHPEVYGEEIADEEAAQDEMESMEALEVEADREGAVPSPSTKVEAEIV